MKVLIETAIGSSQEAKVTLSSRGTAYVAMCPFLYEARTYAALSPDGFVPELAKGNVPQWLEPVHMPQDVGLKVWRVALD